jgi:hypothetical protein
MVSRIADMVSHMSNVTFDYRWDEAVARQLQRFRRALR